MSRFAVLAALGLGLLFLGAAAARWSAAVGSRQPEQPALPGETRALAYVLVPAGERQDDRLQAHAAAIESQCAEHRLTLAGIVLDVESARLGRRRPALDAAMTRLIAGEVDFLMVSRFDDPGDTGVARQPLARVAGAGRPIWRDVADRDREASDG